MREVGAQEAKTHLPRLLDAVERGETVVITRRGAAIARLSPIDADKREQVAQAIARTRALRRRLPRIPLDELLAARHEGHKY